MSCCRVLFVYRKVPLGCVCMCVCVCVCVLLRAMGLDREIGPPSSLMTIECVSQDDSLLRAPGWLALVPHIVGNQKERFMYVCMYVCVCAALTE